MRTDSTRSSARRKLRSEMISAPQGDFKHTGHVGPDGAYFGDLSFLGGSKGNVSCKINCTAKFLHDNGMFRERINNLLLL